jgi:anti-sigma factor RsiW
MTGPSLLCDRARLWASLAVDGEISELERASLAAHASACPACAAYAAGLGALAGVLRTAPPVEPGRLLFRREPLRYTRVRAIQVLAAAAAVVAAVGLGHFAASLTAPGGAAPSRSAVAATQEPYVEQSLLALLARPSGPAPHGRMLPV